MNLTIATTLLALIASSAISTTVHGQEVATAVGEAPQPATARHLRIFGRKPSTGGGSAPAPVPVPAPRPAPAPGGGGGLTFGQAVDGTIASVSLGATILPLVPSGSSKNACRQVACWVATTTETCGTAAANQVQADVMRGRDAYSVESTSEGGMWVRYWRTQFVPPNQGTLAEGACGGDSKFVVNNCQAGGEVKC